MRDTAVGRDRSRVAPRPHRLTIERLEERVLLSGRRAADDFPNSFNAASTIPLAADGSGTQTGIIERKNDMDIFRFVAPVSGRMTVDHAARPGSRVDSALFLTANDGRYVPDQFVSSGRKVIDVTAGATYFAGAFAYGKKTGAYQITFRTEAGSGGAPGTPATTLTLTATAGDDVITIGDGGTGLRHFVMNGTVHDLEAEYGRDAFNQFTRIQVNLLGGNDRITIDPSVTIPAVIEGGDGDDVITGGAGHDTLRGGPGADLLIGGAGNDLFDGGLDSDSVSGLAGGNTLLGGDGHDSLLGGSRDDLLDGGAGNDSLNGGAGGDFMDAGPGTNSLTGGTGIDTWVILGTDSADSILVESDLRAATRTTLGMLAQQDRFTDLSSLEDRLSVNGYGGDDSITQTGATAAEIWGGDGNDTVRGGSGDDAIEGGPGNDQLFGMVGHDQLFGYSGDDTVDGGDGNDTIIGSGGADLLRPGTGTNQVLLDGLSNASGGATLAAAGARSASGIQVSFTKTVTIPVSVRGFSGSATATVTVNGSLGSNGIVSGTLSATGSASGTGFGCTAQGTFTASGSANGPLDAVTWSVTYAGSGTVSCRDGSQFSGGLSGGYSGVVSLLSGSGSQALTGNSSGGVSGSSSMEVPEFRVSSALPRARGDAHLLSCPVVSAGSTARSSTRATGTIELNPNFSERTPIGIYIQDHEVVTGPGGGTTYDHTSILIVPTNQDRWRNDSRFKLDPQTGRRYVTIGAGSSFPLPPWGKLVGNLNRPTDVPEANRQTYRIHVAEGVPEDAFIERLLSLEIAYKDDLRYDPFPEDTSGQYNSNSFVSGLLWRAGIAPREHVQMVPGWSTPIPARSLGPCQ